MLAIRKFIGIHVPSLVRTFSNSHRLCSHDLVTHMDSVCNNSTLPFEFTNSNMQRLCALIRSYPIGSERSAVAGALDLAQRQDGWVSISAMNKIAEILHIPRIRVYEVATFYTMNKRSYKGKYHVQVCWTTPCMIRGADYILQSVEKATDCHVGGVSLDKMFGVDIVHCQGACVNAPMMCINDDYYEDLTCENAVEILVKLKCGQIPPVGPYNGRCASEPICGLTTLLKDPPCPGFKLQDCLKTCPPPSPPPCPPPSPPPPPPCTPKTK